MWEMWDGKMEIQKHRRADKSGGQSQSNSAPPFSLLVPNLGPGVRPVLHSFVFSLPPIHLVQLIFQLNTDSWVEVDMLGKGKH